MPNDGVWGYNAVSDAAADEAYDEWVDRDDDTPDVPVGWEADGDN